MQPLQWWPQIGEQFNSHPRKYSKHQTMKFHWPHIRYLHASDRPPTNGWNVIFQKKPVLPKPKSRRRLHLLSLLEHKIPSGIADPAHSSTDLRFDTSEPQVPPSYLSLCMGNGYLCPVNLYIAPLILRCIYRRSSAMAEIITYVSYFLQPACFASIGQRKNNVFTPS